MANQVVVKDIGALEQFASQLEKAKQELDTVASSLQSAMSRVGSSWIDPQKERCFQEIEAIQKQAKAFGEKAQQQVSYCKRLAAHLRSTPH
jgi:uncharacterized protein YukE